MTDDHQTEFTQSGPASETGVRHLMQQIQPFLAGLPLAPSRAGDIEIAVAEALNNVAEHGYAGRLPGQVHVALSWDATQLIVIIRDAGQAMPGLTPPDPDLPDSSGTLDSLPEGGFGWHLIRQLVSDLEYARLDGQNHLTLRFDIDLAQPD